MYDSFYGLAKLPFQSSPDPDFLFLGPSHREALASIEYGVETGMGFVLITGEVGLGKTTLIRTFLRRADRGKLFPIYIFHPLLRFEGLVTLMSEELGLASDDAPAYQKVRRIQRHLIERYEAGQRVVLIVDEAHRLPDDTLENLRLISNLETDDSKLLQIILVAQPELEATLAEPRLRQLEQRIALRARLEPLSQEEAEEYIRHRLRQAGAGAADAVIAPEAIGLIARQAAGVPRRINAIADLALAHSFGSGERPVSARQVRATLAATPGKPSKRQSRWRLPGLPGLPWLRVGAAAAVIAVVLGSGLFAAHAINGWLSREPKLPPPLVSSCCETPAAPVAAPLQPRRVEAPPAAPPPVAPTPAEPADDGLRLRPSSGARFGDRPR